MFHSLFHKINVCLCSLYLYVCRELYKLLKTNTCNQEKIIISMTSWSKRIKNVPIVINSILQNSMSPDKIVLNLSLAEFPNKEYDLPNEITRMQQDGIIEIGWQEGNTKAYKKIIPTMIKYPYDAILSIDDDFIYPLDFIETFVNMHKKYPNNPLSGNTIEIYGAKAHCGCASLVKREYYGFYLEELLDEEIIRLGTDDIFYTMCAAINSTRYLYVGKSFFYNMEQLPQIDRLSTNDECFRMNQTYLIIRNRVLKHLKINISILREPFFVIH